MQGFIESLNRIDWEEVASFVGVLGFCLSAYLLILDFHRRRTKFAIQDVGYSCKKFKEEGASIFLRAIVINKSSSPISVTRICLLDDNNNEYPFALHEALIVSAGRRSKGELVETSTLTSTQFPVHLLEHGAKLVHAYIPTYHIETLESLQFPLLRPPDISLEADLCHTNMEHKLHIQFPLENEEPLSAYNWEYRLRVYTSKRTLHFSGVARYIPFSEFRRPAIDMISFGRYVK